MNSYFWLLLLLWAMVDPYAVLQMSLVVLPSFPPIFPFSLKLRLCPLIASHSEFLVCGSIKGCLIFPLILSRLTQYFPLSRLISVSGYKDTPVYQRRKQYIARVRSNINTLYPIRFRKGYTIYWCNLFILVQYLAGSPQLYLTFGYRYITQSLWHCEYSSYD